MHARADDFLAIEGRIEEEAPQEGLELEVVLAQERSVFSDAFRLRRDALEVRDKAFRHPARAGLLLEDRRDESVPVELARDSEHGLLRVVVEPRMELVLALARHPATGQSSRGFLHVRLRVIADAQAEELHELAREVLVGIALLVHLIVEVGELAGSRSIEASRSE